MKLESSYFDTWHVNCSRNQLTRLEYRGSFLFMNLRLKISAQPQLRFQRLNILGAYVDRLTRFEVLQSVAASIAAKNKILIGNHNFHSLYIYQKSPEMRNFYARADLIEIDSVPMIIWARALGHKLSLAHRSTYLDYREDFWAMAQDLGWRVFHVGGKTEHNKVAKDAILKRYPSVHLDMHHGYFPLRGEVNSCLIADIADKKPDVLLVGMGMPRQEIWIINNLEKLPDCAIMPVGAAFDYEAGAVYTPPRWTGRLGLEWLVRFVCEPRRLFERYFVQPWALIPHAIFDVIERLKDKSPLPSRVVNLKNYD
jgi:N-acetylglucosaminyldiphosphoundecaprenol N-acetyl-beta-D-mannosaminyltransferase